MPVLQNSKHELFAQARAQGQSATAAFVSAGYAANDSNAARLNGNERVRARVEEIQAVGADKAGLTIEWVLSGLRSNYERAMQAEEIRNADGGTGEYKYEGSVANKALELIGKHLGMFKDADAGATVNIHLASGDADL